MSTLSEQDMDTVEQTAPILSEHGLAITTHFYETLFTKHPEVKPMFSSETGLQAEKLAGAVLAYAKNIRNLDALGPAVQRMAAAHVGAGVQPAHYDVVGAQLLESIDVVLGGVDQSILDAWGAAYGQLASIMISTEAELAASGEGAT